MSNADAGVKFANDRAMSEMLKALTDGFTRMGAVAEFATTPQAALHEAIATANAAFSALPLPPTTSGHSGESLRAAALAAHQKHIELLRTLADFDATHQESRMTHNRRVGEAVKASNASREALVFAVDKHVVHTGQQTPTSNETKSRELVDLATLVYGEPERNDAFDRRTTYVRGDIAAAARTHNSLEALFDKVNEHYTGQAAALEQQRGAPSRRGELPTPVVQPIIDGAGVGQNIVLDKLAKHTADEVREKFQRDVSALFAPVRRRADAGAFMAPLIASAARLRAHPEFVPGTDVASMLSTVKALPRATQDLEEYLAEFSTKASTFEQLLRSFFVNLQRAAAYPWMVLNGEELTKKQQKRIVLANRANELRTRLAEFTSQTLYEPNRFARRVKLATTFLEDDAGRIRTEIYWRQYHLQLRSLLEAPETETELLALLANGPAPRDEKFVAAVRTLYADELARLNVRMLLEDADSGVGRALTPREKLAAARAEIADRLYESASSVKSRLEQSRSLDGVVFELAGSDVRVSGNVAALVGTLALPSGDERTPDQIELDRLSQSGAPTRDVPSGINIFADPALDDGALWRDGFRGTLAPDIVEFYFGSTNRTSDDERIARLPLLQAYVRSVGKLNRDTYAGFRHVDDADTSTPTFEEIVEGALRAAAADGILPPPPGAESLISLVARLRSFSVDNDRTRVERMLASPTPSVLEKVPSPNTPAGAEMRRAALYVIDIVLKSMRTETLSTVYMIGDALSMLSYTTDGVLMSGSIDRDVGLALEGRVSGEERQRLLERREARGARSEDVGMVPGFASNVRVAPETQLTIEQQQRLLRSVEQSGIEVIDVVQRSVTSQATVANVTALELHTLNRTAVSIDMSLRQFTQMDFAAARRANAGGTALNSTGSAAEKADDAAQLVYIGHRVPARLFDKSLGDLIADIQFRANTTNLEASNQAALERVLDSADVRMMRTITRYDIAGNAPGENKLYVDDVYRYTTAKQAQRLQIVDVFDQSIVTMTLRDPITDAVTARVLDRVVLGADPSSLTNAQTLIDSLRAETAASAAGQPLLALVAALFVRARLRDTRPSAASYIGIDDEVTLLERLMAMPRRGYAAFKSLKDIAEAFMHESNFSSQAQLALAIAFANVNYLVLLFGVARALWPAFVLIVRSLGFVDVLARLMFSALFTVARKIGLGMSWTLVGQLLNVFEKLSRQHPRAGARRRELQLLRSYVEQMSDVGLTPLDAIPNSPSRETLVDRLQTFVNEFGSPARSGVARRTFDTMAGALFAPLRALFAKIPQSISAFVATTAWVASGESSDSSPFSLAPLIVLNVSTVVLLVATREACQNVWLSFFKVFVTNIVTRAAFRATFDLVLKALPRGETSSTGDRFVRGVRSALTTLSVIGPDLTSYLSGREFVVTDKLIEAANEAAKAVGIESRFDTGASGMFYVGGTSAAASASVLRFIDRPSQAVESYAAFAGRFAGRTLWGALRAWYETRRLATLTRTAAREQQRTSREAAVALALSPTTPDDEESRYVDDLDLYETLNNETSKAELSTAFFKRPADRDLWYELTVQVISYREPVLSIDLQREKFGPADETNRYTPQRPEWFLFARNFLTLVARLRDERFRNLDKAVLRFYVDYNAATKAEAVRGVNARLAQHQATAASKSGLDVEIEFFDDDAEPARAEEVPINGGWVAWRTFSVETRRFRELGVLIDRIERQLADVRLIQVSLVSSTELGEDGKFVFINSVLEDYFGNDDADVRKKRAFIQLLDDVDIDRFAAESFDI